MLDNVHISILKALNKLSNNTSYKVVTTEEILSFMQNSNLTAEDIALNMDILEKQNYLNIKFSEENTYCYSLTEKAKLTLSQEEIELKPRASRSTFMQYVYVAIASFIGTLLALLILIYVIF